LELLTENGVRTQELIGLYRKLVQGEKSPASVWSSLRATQRLGVTRGTLDR
jgi:putative protease